MNLVTLLNIVAAQTQEPLGIVEQIVNTTIAEIGAAVERGDVAEIDGLGTFRLHDRRGHEHRGSDGGMHSAPPYRELVFRPAKVWRKRLAAVQQAEAAD